MRTPITLLLFVAVALVSFGSQVPAPATVTKSQQGSYEVTKSVRTNGCTLVLRRYTKSKPYLQGRWTQLVYVGDKGVMRIQHSAVEKEQLLGIEPGTGYGVLLLDRNLDGKYEMFVVVSLKDQSLKDVLYTTDDGWLRHATPEEFQERLRLAEKNRHAMEELDKTISDALKKANQELNK